MSDNSKKLIANSSIPEIFAETQRAKNSIQSARDRLNALANDYIPKTPIASTDIPEIPQIEMEKQQEIVRIQQKNEEQREQYQQTERTSTQKLALQRQEKAQKAQSLQDSFRSFQGKAQTAQFSEKEQEIKHVGQYIEQQYQEIQDGIAEIRKIIKEI